jgi:hypothetical protein
VSEPREWWLVVSEKSVHSCVCESYMEAKRIAELWNEEYPGLKPFKPVHVREVK